MRERMETMLNGAPALQVLVELGKLRQLRLSGDAISTAHAMHVLRGCTFDDHSMLMDVCLDFGITPDWLHERYIRELVAQSGRSFIVSWCGIARLPVFAAHTTLAITRAEFCSSGLNANAFAAMAVIEDENQMRSFIEHLASLEAYTLNGCLRVPTSNQEAGLWASFGAAWDYEAIASLNRNLKLPSLGSKQGYHTADVQTVRTWVDSLLEGGLK